MDSWESLANWNVQIVILLLGSYVHILKIYEGESNFVLNHDGWLGTWITL